LDSGEVVSATARRRAILAAADRLIAEFDGRLAAGTVLRTVAVSARELRVAGLRADLSDALTAAVRTRLLRALDGPPQQAGLLRAEGM
jgi:hypothetical protein